MRFLGALALLAIGFGAGWAFRDSRAPEAPVRADRQEASRGSGSDAPPKPEALPPGYEPATPPPDEAPPPDEITEADAAPDSEPAAEEPDPEAKKLAGFMRSMLPLMKMQSTREGREEAAEIAKLLGLDERREKQLADAIANDKVRKLEEGVLPMLEGKEPDEAMLANLNETDGMSGALEKDLSLILNTHELDTVKTHYREQHEEAQRRSIEAEIAGLAIPDLSKDQERELRALLKAEQKEVSSISTGSAGSLGSGGFKMKLKKSLSKDGMVESLDEEYRARREKLARLLSTDQLAHLDKQHEEQRKEAEAAAGMLGEMFGAFLTDAPAKKDD